MKTQTHKMDGDEKKNLRSKNTLLVSKWLTDRE